MTTHMYLLCTFWTFITNRPHLFIKVSNCSANAHVSQYKICHGKEMKIIEKNAQRNRLRLNLNIDYIAKSVYSKEFWGCIRPEKKKQ